MSFPKHVNEGRIEDYSAVQLFVQSARRVRVDFKLADDPASVIRICQHVEGMPLGIELAATWLRLMSCHEIAAHFDRNLDFLVTPMRNVPERHRSMRAVFEQSWGLLPEIERRVLAALSIFRGGFDLEAATQVASASLTVLARLADKSLIRMNPPDRYDLHELLPQYVHEKLVESGEVALTLHRHLEHFLALAEQGEAYLYGLDQITWFDRLEVEQGNLRVALAWSLESEAVESGLRLAGALGWFWELRAHWGEGRD